MLKLLAAAIASASLFCMSGSAFADVAVNVGYGVNVYVVSPGTSVNVNVPKGGVGTTVQVGSTVHTGGSAKK